MYVGRHSAAIKLQLQAAEKYNFKCRLKEEEVLLLKEMKSLLCFYNKQIESLSQEISGRNTSVSSVILYVKKILSSKILVNCAS